MLACACVVSMQAWHARSDMGVAAFLFGLLDCFISPPAFLPAEVAASSMLGTRGPAGGGGGMPES